MESLLTLFDELNLEPRYQEFILEKKKLIKDYYYEQIFNTGELNINDYLHSLYFKWMRIWQQILGTGNLILTHTIPTLNTFGDLFKKWDQLCMYYQIKPQLICDMYQQILIT